MTEIQEIKLDEIYADDDFNCRDRVSAIDVVDLARSITKDGLIQPVVVTPLKEPIEGCKFKIVAGFRRLKAFYVNESPTIPCIVRDDLDEKASRVINLTENLTRHNLSIVEEAKALLPLFRLGLNEYEIAAELPSASRGWVQIRMMVLKLPPEVQDDASAGFLTQTQIRDLYTLKSRGATNDELFELTKQIKDAKHKKKVNPHIPRKMSPGQAKRIRKKPEMFSMMDHMFVAIGPCFGTRILAWAAGEISDLDLFGEIKIEAEKIGLNYDIPSQSV